MPRVLIAGCGYVGAAAGELFLREGWEVEGWTSRKQSAERLRRRGFSAEAVDLRKAKAVREAARPADLVIQSTSTRGGSAEEYRETYLAGAMHLLEAFPRVPLLFCSSTSVYAQQDGSWVDEQSPATPGVETGQVLRDAERLVLERNGIVLRLAGIYGPGRSFLLQSLLDGTAKLSPAPDRYLNQVHRDDVASAFLCLARVFPLSGALRPWIFNVTDDEPALRNDSLSWLADTLDLPVMAASANEPPRRRGQNNKRVSNARLRQLGWAPRYASFRAGMCESVLPAHRAAVR